MRQVQRCGFLLLCMLVLQGGFPTVADDVPDTEENSVIEDPSPRVEENPVCEQDEDTQEAKEGPQEKQPPPPLEGKPNILLIVTDEERYPPQYLPDHVKDWLGNLPGKRQLDANGRATHFISHRTSSTACSPSRATLYTGHFPSLHGVSQTFGIAKTANDPAMRWLLPKDVPTMGAYFRAGGYETYYIGKWHISYEDLVDDDGFVIENPEAYQNANPLDKFGWDGWLGPEPHGASFSNLGWARDPGYVQEFELFLQDKEEERKANGGLDAKPWVVALNLVNPHDIVFPDMVWRLAGRAKLYDEDTPQIPLPPTFHEDLGSKPSIQKEYVDRFAKKMFSQPQLWTHFLRFYAFLIKTVDRHILTVLEALDKSSFANNTIRVHTADHGDMQGAHGGMIQKWHQAYEESLHIPLVIQDPRIEKEYVNQQVHVPTQSVDVLPTLLSLADLDAIELQEALKGTHQEVHPLPGRDLTTFLKHDDTPSWKEENGGALTYFQLNDQVSRGSIKEHSAPRMNPILKWLGNWGFNALGSRKDGKDVATHIEGIVFQRTSDDHTIKFMRYYDDPQYWTEPGVQDVRKEMEGLFKLPLISGYGKVIVKTQPAPEVYEIYDITEDPTEVNNLASSDPSLMEEVKDKLQEARNRYHVQRTHQLQPAKEQNADMPTEIKEHMDIPIQFTILAIAVTCLLYAIAAGLLWFVLGSIMVEGRPKDINPPQTGRQKLKET